MLIFDSVDVTNYNASRMSGKMNVLTKGRSLCRFTLITLYSSPNIQHIVATGYSFISTFQLDDLERQASSAMIRFNNKFVVYVVGCLMFLSICGSLLHSLSGGHAAEIRRAGENGVVWAISHNNEQLPVEDPLVCELFWRFESLWLIRIPHPSRTSP